MYKPWTSYKLSSLLADPDNQPDTNGTRTHIHRTTQIGGKDKTPSTHRVLVAMTVYMLTHYHNATKIATVSFGAVTDACYITKVLEG